MDTELMHVPELLEHLEAEGSRLVAAVERTDWDARVPHLDWTVREVVVHVGGVHRWAADVIRTGANSPATEAGAAVGTDPGGPGLLVWFSAGHAELVDALRSAPADLDTFTFLPADSPLHFWARRQAHETAMHRADVEAAAGGSSEPFDPAFALDGIEELLNGFARRRSNRIDRDARVVLTAGDGTAPGRSWELVFGGERIEINRPEPFGWANATVHGTPDHLYRWLWNRPAQVTVNGDTDVAALFGRSVRVNWS